MVLLCLLFAVLSTFQEEGESGSDDVDREKGKGRKKIRKVMSKKKLAQETRDAAEEERERRKRVLKRRQEVLIITPKKNLHFFVSQNMHLVVKEKEHMEECQNERS